MIQKIHSTSKMKGNFSLPKRIHFMGIGGSGISGIAILAKKYGFEVEGCDLEKETAYSEKVKSEKIKVLAGHDAKHVEDADLVVTSPAILYVNKDHAEVLEAKRLKKLVTWEEFLGKNLHKDKKVICVAGTHGKSTTTAMLAKVLVEAKFDPTVTIGATIKEWNANYKKGDGDYFVTEADEFNDNFLYYQPSAVILNNIEMDHADYFKDKEQVLRSFCKFLKKLKKDDVLVFNYDSPGVKSVLQMIGDESKNVQCYGYTFDKSLKSENYRLVHINIQEASEEFTKFNLTANHLDFDGDYELSVPGDFNVANASGVIILSKILGVSEDKIKKTLKSFNGIGRRLELVGEKGGIKVYDDYAHHPTAVKATIGALRQKYPKSRIWAVNEPHSYSRTKALFDEYEGAFDKADRVIIAPIFKARDKENFGITEEKLLQKINHPDATVLDSFDKIVSLVKKEAKKGDVILVMGAGKSYVLAKDILKSL